MPGEHEAEAGGVQPHSTVRPPQPPVVEADVERALAEDIGNGDLSAAAIPTERFESAHVVAREAGVVCGRPWFDAVFGYLDATVESAWWVGDGERVGADTPLATLQGPARALYTGERTALNFLGLLSGVATSTRRYADAVADWAAVILDTRKTVPGLRTAQKYAVACGGGTNHRMGLYDAAMLKENHLHAAGGIASAIHKLRQAHPGAPLTVEVETLAQLAEAIAAGADRVLLDNFSLGELRRAVATNAGRAWLEASGSVGLDHVAEIAATGVDAISVGALTKDVHSLDLSMRFRTG